jgi:hypothetical protein
MTEHYRSDFSSFHVVSYDTLSGEVEHKHTSQGFSHESAWARGQSWGLYGYVMMYRETGHIEYLEHAKKVAGFLINHPRMPEDMVPYWDYDYPGIPDTFRDVSAAAIMTSFLEVAEKQIRALSSSYRNELGTAGNFILNHSVGHFPNGTEVDAPLTYADYYYVEALMRMKKLLATKK